MKQFCVGPDQLRESWVKEVYVPIDEFAPCQTMQSLHNVFTWKIAGKSGHGQYMCACTTSLAAGRMPALNMMQKAKSLRQGTCQEFAIMRHRASSESLGDFGAAGSEGTAE